MNINDFHIGDRVIGLPGAPYGITHEGWKGYVIAIHSEHLEVSRYNNRSGSTYWVNPHWFKVINCPDHEETKKKEVDIMSIINENERRILLGEIKNLLDEYDYTYTERALNKIIDEWARQKATLITAFKTHPNYLEGKFMIVFDVDYERVVNKSASNEFTNWICSWGGIAHQMMDSLPEDIKNAKRPDQYLPDELFAFFCRLKHIAERTISSETADKLNEIAPAVHAHAGQKTSRVINKLCTYLGYNKHPDYNKEFAKYADSLSPLSIKRHTILSLNPLDYLTMSFGNSWASCHTIDKRNKRDMPNSYEGQYSSGTMSYMLDGSSMVLYTVDADYNGNDYWTQPKINRQMYHWGEEKLVQGRLYPQSCDYEDGEYAPYRNIVQQIISDIFKFPNLWSLSKGSSAASKYICTEGTHYPDYKNFSNCTLSRVRESENENYFTVGAEPICIECGCTHSENDCISCCSSPSGRGCADCGCYIDDDEAIYVDGEYYCRDCVSHCECCDSYHRDESYWVESEGRYICENCFDNYYTSCGYCGEVVSRDDAYWVENEGEYVCEDCVDEHYFRCDKCDEYYRNDERNQLAGRHLCDDCYEEVTEYEDEDEEEAC